LENISSISGPNEPACDQSKSLGVRIKERGNISTTSINNQKREGGKRGERQHRIKKGRGGSWEWAPETTKPKKAA